MCGEKLAGFIAYNVASGSPPHVRGKARIIVIWQFHFQDHPRMCGEKRFSSVCGPCIKGITPACAGKRAAATIGAIGIGDHPRMCGEKIINPMICDFDLGSPPHVRGKVHGAAHVQKILGITPACAGKRLKRSRSTVPHAAIVPLFPSVCNKPAGSDGSPAGHDAPPFLPIENAAPASPAYNLRSL